MHPSEAVDAVAYPRGHQAKVLMRRRPPNWRHLLTLTLLDAGRQPPVADHHLTGIHTLVGLQRRARSDEETLPARLDPYRRALDIYIGVDEPVRAALESHILAGRRA